MAAAVTAGVAVFGVISVCYANLATGVVAARDAGVLKRLRGTPLPPWAYVAGRVGASVVVAVTQVVVMVGLAAALQADFNPLTRGSGLRLHDLAALLGWALVATVVAVRRFRWDPHGEHQPGRGRRSVRGHASMEGS